MSVRVDRSGLLYLCMDGRRAITSLISALLVPNDEMRVSDLFNPSAAASDSQDALLNLLFTIFKIKLPTWKDAFLDGKRLTGMSLITSHEILR
jgi:rapamycin-insensitive companion of mTOR